ncbi:glycopeptide antibiotics resistance protein [Paenibacillus sp. 4624]|uniref:VanZ family protein n=1 Tax=Paenibacillus sp. 4624 TaxID=3156453 RepID=UPI003D206B0F
MSRRALLYSKRVLAFITFLAVIYTLIMCNLLFFSGRAPGVNYQYNLVPFETIRPLLLERERYSTEARIKNLFGNIVLFIPLGIWIPWLFHRYRSWFRLTFIVVLILLLVETIQLITRVGSLDVDDIILNTVGAWIGFAGFRLLIGSPRKTRS